MRITRWAFLAPALLLFAWASGAAGQPVESSGAVLLQLEKTKGVLTEGFILDVRIDTPDGHPVLASTWDDLVNDGHSELTMEDYYRSVVRTPVPTGPFVVTTVMHPGMEDAQEPCLSRGTMKPGGVVSITVRFWPTNGCAAVS